ncbi:hypothetical protein GCK32_001088 [Trichostrongylus colubriformis]|uniref:Uncharacterized protein n=1 Tax=Trichostrongylus colubriformis TaxID=6319 RepID=A0AAN8EWY7_TRICO
MLHRNNQLVPTEDLKGFPYDPRSYRIPRKPLRNSRKLLRPAYWPDFDAITSTVSSWSEYASERKSFIKSAREAADIRRQARAQEVHSEYDFEVFLSDRFMHSLSLSPAFRVICFDSRQAALSCAYTHRFASDIPLVLSIFDCGYICFIEISGESIDLNRYLENLRRGKMGTSQ